MVSIAPRMHLEVRGEGTVTAADIIAPAEVEVVNPELYLFTVDNAKTKLDLEFTVERGRGYSPANERSGHIAHRWAAHRCHL